MASFCNGEFLVTDVTVLVVMLVMVTRWRLCWERVGYDVMLRVASCATCLFLWPQWLPICLATVGGRAVYCNEMMRWLAGTLAPR